MINGMKEMMDFAEEQLDMFAYWDNTLTDPRDMSVKDMVAEFAVKADQKPNKEMSATLIEEEFEEWSEQYHNGIDDTNELKELADLVYVVYGYARAKNWDLDEAVRRVHKNNVGRMYQPDGAIKRRADGKIVKNPSYPKVDLKDLV
jgi:predicted HAD superfamily Cof-like phosphohydrolase